MTGIKSSEPTCTYHPTIQPSFYCNNCGEYYCTECVSWRKNSHFSNCVAYMCPRCNAETQSLGVGTVLKPFYTCLMSFFAYPRTIFAIALIVMYGLTQGILFYCLKEIGIVYFSLRLALFFLMLLYCNDVFYATVKGNFIPPPIGMGNDGGVVIVFKQLLLILLVTLCGGSVVALFGVSRGHLAFYIITFFVPAMIILILVNKSLRSALNPLRIILIVKKIGFSYCVLYILTDSLFRSEFVLLNTIVRLDVLPDLFVKMLFYASQAYFYIIIYHLLAYVVVQYHQKLDYPIDYTDFLKKQDSVLLKKYTSVNPILKDIQCLLREGNPKKALGILKKESTYVLKNSELTKIFMQLLDDQGEDEAALYFSVPAISLFIQSKLFKDAAQLYQKYIIDRDGITIKANELFALYQWYTNTTQYIHALHCGVKFISEYRGDPRNPDIHFECITYAMEEQENYRFAIDLAQQFSAAYPSDSRAFGVDKKRVWMEQQQSIVSTSL